MDSPSISKEWVTLEIKSATGPIKGLAERIERDVDRIGSQANRAESKISSLESGDREIMTTLRFLAEETKETKKLILQVIWGGIGLLITVIGMALKEVFFQ